MATEQAIGVLQHNGTGWEVVGACCEGKAARKPNSRIFAVNVEPYSQSCACCGQQLVAPRTPAWCELYDGKAH